MAGMPLNPMESDLMGSVERNKTLPEVRVLDLLPVFQYPFLQPAFGDGIDHVLGVTPDLDSGVIPLDGLQADNHGKKFHPVVGGLCKSSADFLHESAAFEHHSIASRAGIAARCTIRIQINCRSAVHLCKFNYFCGKYFSK